MNDERIQASSDTVELPTVPPREGSDRGSRRTVAALAAALVLTCVGAGALLAAADGDSSDGTAAAAPAAAPTDVGPSATPATLPTLDGASGDSTGSGGDPTPPPPPAAPGHLVVSTTHLNLGQNVFTGSFEVHNDGGSPIDWAWDANHPAVSAAPAGGTLAPGESTVVEVTVHWQQLGNGGYMFQTHVTADGQQLNVLVSGSKHVVVNPDVQLPDPQLKP